MKIKNNYLVSIIVFSTLLLLSLACGASSATDTPQPKEAPAEKASLAEIPTDTLAAAQEKAPGSTNKPEPTKSPKPTNTPKPTDTPEPTNTPNPTATPTPAPIGYSRYNPLPRSEKASVPNWDVQVLEVKRGEAAWTDIQTANMFNDPAPAGMEYILVKLYVKSTYSDSDEHTISDCDFNVTGDLLVNYTCSMVNVVEPEPQLDAKLFTGGEAEGWLAYPVGQGEGNLILVFDPIFSFDTSDIRYIALDEGASIGISPDLADIKQSDLGKERSNPVPRADKLITEDWEISLVEEARGEAAWKMVHEVNQFNDPPADGMEYIALKVHARYIGTEEKAENIDGSFFNTTGSANVLYDLPSVVDPEPALDVSLYPGGEYEGWIVVQASKGEGNLLLVFKPLFSFNDSDIRYIALDEGASISIPTELADIKPINLGSERSNPAPRTEKIITEDWEIQVVEVVRGADAWKMVKEANQFNDPPVDGMEYVAIKVHVRYIATDATAENIDGSFFKSTGSANVLYDAPSVVDPKPTLDAALYPGGEYEGWIVVQAAQGETGIVLIFNQFLDFGDTNQRFILLEP